MTLDYTIFREHLQQLIKARGLTAKAFGEEINTTPATISRYLSGSRTPDLPYVVKISQYFNISIDWLLGVNGSKFEILPAEVQDVANRYQLATPQDRRVIQAVLDKYKTEE